VSQPPARDTSVPAAPVPAALCRDWHTLGTVRAQTRRGSGDIVDREGGGFSPTLGWGAAANSPRQDVSG
jgi:hypothetical protein